MIWVFSHPDDSTDPYSVVFNEVFSVPYLLGKCHGSVAVLHRSVVSYALVRSLIHYSCKVLKGL